MNKNSKETIIPSHRSIIQLQVHDYLQQLKHKEFKSFHHRRQSDPVNSQIYVHQFDQSSALPQINASTRRSKTVFLENKIGKKKPEAKRITKYETLPCDFQCQQKFPNSLSQRVRPPKQISSGKNKFLQIDILTLETCYAKNPPSNLKQYGQQNKISVKPLVSVPSKQKLSDFIKTYQMSNQSMDIDELVRSKYFAVRLDGADSLYFGDVRGQQMDGKGVMINSNWIFEGEWCKSKRIEGVEITLKGKYKGRFVNNERSKVGEYFWNNGEYYSGEWQNNKKNGTGIWKSKKGDIYMGQWSKDKVEGYGIHLNVNGQKYEGLFQNFLKHGQGKQYFPNGDYFQGNFKQGKPQGLGTYKWKGGLIYEGEFEQGYRSGKGKILKNDMQYQGFFQKEKAHGQGKLTVWNNYSFVGSFKKGKKQGKGIKKESKRVFVGEWHNNRFIEETQ